jgi:hypothetical protein
MHCAVRGCGAQAGTRTKVLGWFKGAFLFEARDDFLRHVVLLGAPTVPHPDEISGVRR